MDTYSDFAQEQRAPESPIPRAFFDELLALLDEDSELIKTQTTQSESPSSHITEQDLESDISMAYQQPEILAALHRKIDIERLYRFLS